MVLCLKENGESLVAIKVLKGAFSSKQMEDFRAEGALMARLRPHKNVVQFLGICQQPPSMILEFCEGGNLFDFVIQKNLSVDDQLDIMKGIGAGMLHLSYEKIVHRDLAARNILLDRGHIPKVSDFGMSRVIIDNTNEGQTKTNVGPIKWMAPESIRTSEYSEKSDV